MLITQQNNERSAYAKKDENSSTACVNCKNEEFKEIIDGYDFDTGEQPFKLESCTQCKLTRTSPLLDDKELSKWYAPSYYGSSEKKFNSLIESWTVFTNNKLAEKILRDYRSKSHNKEAIQVIDIGCGRANLLKAFKRLGCKCFGVERSDFPADQEMADIHIYKQDLLDIHFDQNSFDLVVIWHVLEHLTDPAAAIEKISQILKPDGLLVIAVPNFGGLQSSLFGKHWFHLDLPRHTYHFSNHSLANLLEANGFTVDSVSTQSLDQGIFGFIQSLMNRLLPGKPNTLYGILKKSGSRPSLAMIVAQFLVAGMILPFAIIEFIVSGFTGNGACLIVRARQK